MPSRCACLAFILWIVIQTAAAAQTPPDSPPPASQPPALTPPTNEAPTPPPPEKIDVQPMAHDEDISARLERILAATDWFQQPRVRVEEGVVFLSGTAQGEQSKAWAGELARRTEDVVAVVNHMDIAESNIWDFGPALAGTREIWKQTISFLPFAAFGVLILGLTWISARLIGRALRAVLRRRMTANLLADVSARAVAIAILLLGLYIVLRVSGLTRLALTVLGGTGLLGLALGIAFRDITENFLASIFLSLQRPFRVGDLVEINGVQGFVQQLNIRSTVMMTLAGNHMQIPNAVVYKSVLFNFTSNPNRREDFTVPIGLGDSIATAQETIMQVLSEHPAVLTDPEPWALVDAFPSNATNLKIYFWIDGSQHSVLKVRSSVMRLVKKSLQERGLMRPVDTRDTYFPRGVEVKLVESSSPADRRADKHIDKPAVRHGNGHPEARPGSGEPDGRAPRPPREANRVYTEAEGNLTSDAEQIEEQVRKSRPPEEGENLLEPKKPAPPPAATNS